MTLSSTPLWTERKNTNEQETGLQVHYIQTVRSKALKSGLRNKNRDKSNPGAGAIVAPARLFSGCGAAVHGASSHNHHFKWWFGLTPHRAIILSA